MPDTPDLMDDATTARLLGLKTHRTLAIWRYRRFGPPFVKIGRLVKYSRTDVASWIASRTQQPNSAA